MDIYDLNKLISCSNEDSRSVVMSLSEKYGCSIEKIYWTFRNHIGCKLRDARYYYREPSVEDFTKALVLTDTATKLRLSFPNICNRQWRGIYDRMLGVSTYSRARELALLQALPTRYIPQTDNNMSMWAACFLGDGSYDNKRKAWRIEHCAKQYGWLCRKVEMFNAAFPQCSTKISHNKKRDTYSWYSCKIGSGKFDRISSSPKHESVRHLNEYGLWYLFLDDGCYCRTSQQLVSYATSNMEIATRLQEKIEEICGVSFRICNEHCITLTGIENVLVFFRSILEPFSRYTPECMKYKTTYVKI